MPEKVPLGRLWMLLSYSDLASTNLITNTALFKTKRTNGKGFTITEKAPTRIRLRDCEKFTDGSLAALITTLTEG